MEHPDLADSRQRESSVAGAPWREPVRGGHPDARLANRPGREQLEAMLNSTTPRPPISRLTGMQLVEFGAGSAMFTMPVSDWLVGADGTIPLGPLTIPADAAMACAIMTLLPAGTSLTTSELGLRQVRAVGPGDIVVARARTLEAGPAVALAEVTLTDDDGTLIAHGGSLCVRLPALTAPPQPGDPTPTPTPNPHPNLSEELDPWERPLPAGAGPGAPPPLWQLIGLRELDAPHGEAAFALPATRWLCAPPPGRVQGGAVATLADAAITAAIKTVEPSTARLEAVELKLNYLRPLASDGRDARAHGRLIHGGRRTAVASAEVVDADGRMIAVVTGSAVAGSST
ncbi:MAG TPA: PaaI family thioesterase [Solirubrobacteraceae bacterium]|nr:PaaI family thioesterase [Solirubrobacteraceae bacterium]